jgi:N-acyl-L-homoserine lactone synthetase
LHHSDSKPFVPDQGGMAKSLDYSKVAFDLIDDLDGLTNVGKVMTRLAATLSEFGYTSFLITGVPEPPQKLEPYILLNGWPRGWTEHYTRSNYYADDPVAAWCRRTVNPFEWSQAPLNSERSPRAAEVMNVAREFGLDHGFLVPIVASTGFQACVTMAGEQPNCEPRAKRALQDATYILAIDTGEIVGGSRLIPTTHPHLLSEVFPHLASVRGLPRAADTYEWTRMFVIKSRREGRTMGGQTRGMVICGVLEHCLDSGLASLTAVVEMFWLPLFHAMGWKLIPLGLPELISGEWSVAVKMPIDKTTLESTRAFHAIAGRAVIATQLASATVTAA